MLTNTIDRSSIECDNGTNHRHYSYVCSEQTSPFGLLFSRHDPKLMYDDEV